MTSGRVSGSQAGRWAVSAEPTGVRVPAAAGLGRGPRAQTPSSRRLRGRGRRSPGQETLGLALDRRPGVAISRVHRRRVPVCAPALPAAWSSLATLSRLPQAARGFSLPASPGALAGAGRPAPPDSIGASAAGSSHLANALGWLRSGRAGRGPHGPGQAGREDGGGGGEQARTGRRGLGTWAAGTGGQEGRGRQPREAPRVAPRSPGRAGAVSNARVRGACVAGRPGPARERGPAPAGAERHRLPLQVGCRLSLVLFQFCTAANFCWLLVEGLHLHTLLVAMLRPRRHLLAYLLVGWGKDCGREGPRPCSGGPAPRGLWRGRTGSPATRGPGHSAVCEDWAGGAAGAPRPGQHLRSRASVRDVRACSGVFAAQRRERGARALTRPRLSVRPTRPRPRRPRLAEATHVPTAVPGWPARGWG